MKELSEKNRERAWLLLILTAGLFARLCLFGKVPGDINRDEAFAAYEAWSLLKTGLDTSGYPFPVYFAAWGSGMNALESYLMLPFVALFGLKVWAIRLPQLIVGLLSLPALYDAARRLWGRREALLAAFLLAVCPWHVLLCRWGLESNLAPGFLLFGLVFFLRGLEDSRWLFLSALMYGLSLYAYATVWLILPPLLLAQLAYCLWTGRLRLDRRLLGAGALLLLLALPLLLFVAVNFGLTEEIVTPFFSIPRLPYLRAGELSLTGMGKNLRRLFTLLFRQTDGLIWNSPGRFGLLYHLSTPFALLGLALALVRAARAGRRFCPETLLLFQLLAGLLPGALTAVNVNRVNVVFLPLLMLAALGLSWLCAKLGRFALPGAVLAYAAAFLCFQVWYAADYPRLSGPSFHAGLFQAVDALEGEEKVYVSESVLYPELLFAEKTDPEEFRATIEYLPYPAGYWRAASFGRWRFGFDPAAPDPAAAYLIDTGTDLDAFREAGFTLTRYGVFTVAKK